MVLHDANSIATFFSLLRSGMYGTPIPESELPESIDWKAVHTLARKHAVVGIIIDSVQFLPERLRPSAATCAKMSKFAMGLIQANLILDKTAARLVAFFKQHDVDGVLLKGQGVARYYRAPQMRQSGDIDFYVGKTLYKKAVDLCKQNLIDEGSISSECEQHYSFNMSGVLIELHRLASRVYLPFRDKRFQKWIVEELEHSPGRRRLTVDNTDITLPSYDFDAIFIFYHAWRHYAMEGGVGLRQLCDWSMIFHTHGSDIDRQRLVENIKRFGMTNGWKLFACIAVSHLGVSEDMIPLYDPTYRKKSEKVLEEILEGGNFGNYSKNVSGDRFHGSVFGKVRNATGYFITLFPLIPIEATFIYWHRLFDGAIATIKKPFQKSDK